MRPIKKELREELKKAKTPISKSGIKLPPIKITKKKRTYPIFISQKIYRVDRNTKQKYKAGMFYATLLNPESMNPSIGIGFSVCNKHAGDKYDYINDKREKGFGFVTAMRRASRWKSYHHAHIGSAKGFPFDNVEFVLIPTFLVKPLMLFIQRCEKYFWKNGTKYPFPMWVIAIRDTINSDWNSWTKVRIGRK